MNHDLEAVYQHIRARIAGGQRVLRKNSRAGHGPSAISAALQIPEKRVHAAIGRLAQFGCLTTPDNGGYSVDETKPLPLSPVVVVDSKGKPAPAPAPLLPPELARRIGMETADEKPAPRIMLDWALHWTRQGVHVFPCRRFLGSPLVDRWYSEATRSAAAIVTWWSEWPEADIAGVPDKSDHFVIIASGDDGADSLADLEEQYGALPAEFRYFNQMADSEHLWIKGSAVTSHGELGRGLHVLGTGHYVYLPESWAPDHSYKDTTHG